MILRVGEKYKAIVGDSLYTIKIIQIRRRGPKECSVRIRLLYLPPFLGWLLPHVGGWYPLARVVGFIDEAKISQEAEQGWTDTDSVDARYAGGNNA